MADNAVAPASAYVKDTPEPGDYRLLLTRISSNGEELVERVYRPAVINSEYVPGEGWLISGTGCALSLPEDM